MRSAIAALLFAAAAGGAPAPASAEVVLFNGVLGIKAASSACSILPYVEQDNLYKATYRPAGIGSNGSATSIMLVPMAAALTELLVSSFTLSNGNLNATYQQVDVSELTSNRRLSLNFEKYKTLMRMAQQTPGDVDGDDFLALTLQIRGFGNVTGCAVTLQGIMTDKSTPLL